MVKAPFTGLPLPAAFLQVVLNSFGVSWGNFGPLLSLKYPSSVSSLSMLLAIESGKEKYPSELLSPTMASSLCYSLSKFQCQHGKKGSTELQQPVCANCWRLPAPLHFQCRGDPASTALDQTDQLLLAGQGGMDRNIAGRNCVCAHAQQELCVCPFPAQAVCVRAPRESHQLIFTESCVIRNWNAWALLTK